MTFADWIPALTSSAVITIGGIILAPIYKATVEKGIQHGLDRKLEELRSQLRSEEEARKQAVRKQEDSIGTIRATALSAMTSRNTTLDKRRIEAIERLWSSTIHLTPAITLAGLTKSFHMDKLHAHAETGKPDSQKYQKLAEFLWTAAGLDDWKRDDSADKERPFLSPLSWALFSAYRSAAAHSMAQVAAMRAGMPPDIMADPKELLDMIKKSIPEFTNYIEERGVAGIAYVLEPMREKLLAQLNNDLIGKSDDQGSIERAAEILKASELAASTLREKEVKEEAGELVPKQPA